MFLNYYRVSIVIILDYIRHTQVHILQLSSSVTVRKLEIFSVECEKLVFCIDISQSVNILQKNPQVYDLCITYNPADDNLTTINE